MASRTRAQRGGPLGKRRASPASTPACVAAYDYWSMCGLAGTLLRAGTSWDRSGRAPLRIWRDSTKGLTGASRGPVLLGGPGRLTCYAIGTTAWTADTRGILHRPILGRPLEQGHPPLDPPGAATLRGAGPGRAAARRARWAGGLGSGLLPTDQAEQRIRDATSQGGVRMRPFESVGP